jgi:hypothetical protein
MLTEETLKRMKDVLADYSEEAIARVDFNKFCQLVDEPVTRCENFDDMIKLVQDVQIYIDQHTANKKVVLGLSEYEHKVHWHVVPKGHIYYNLGPLYIVP